VEVSFDDRGGAAAVRVQGFDAAFAQRLNKAILERASASSTRPRTAWRASGCASPKASSNWPASGCRRRANAVLAFQNKHRLLDPTAQAQATGALTAELEATRSRLEAELNGLLAFLNEDAYQVQALRARIAALDKQIDTERARATTDGRRGERLNSLAIEFQGLQLQAQFAQDAYKLALGRWRMRASTPRARSRACSSSSRPRCPRGRVPAEAYNLTPCSPSACCCSPSAAGAGHHPRAPGLTHAQIALTCCRPATGRAPLRAPAPLLAA
jgi:capsular polysaccharide transport system permease protein